MVCEHCHHSNPEAWRFCGICGHELVKQPAPVLVVGSAPPEPEPVRSVLGLTSPPTETSFSYLLEDNTPPRRSHGPLLLAIVLIAVLGGLAYLYWQRVYAPIANLQPPPPQTVPPPAFAYQKIPPLVLANAQLAVAATQPALPNRNAFDQLALASLAERQKEEADPRNNPQFVAGLNYLHGNGVPENCHKALENLKAAAKQNNSPALAQLAVMSASGHCMKRNRVQAYQWFAQAKQADPNNGWLDRSMDMLWANMSRHERSLLLK
jgi:hypothetical protein